MCYLKYGWCSSLVERTVWPSHLYESSFWEPGGLQSMGSQESDTTKQINHHHWVLTNWFNIIVVRLRMSWDRLETRLNVLLRNFRGMPNMSGPQEGHKLPWHRSRLDMTSSRTRQGPVKIKTWAILRWSSHLSLSNPSCGGKPSLSLLVWAGVRAVVAGVGKKECLLCEFRWMMIFAQIESWRNRILPAFLYCHWSTSVVCTHLELNSEPECLGHSFKTV